MSDTVVRALAPTPLSDRAPSWPDELLDAMPFGVVWIDEACTVVSLSRPARLLLGLSDSVQAGTAYVALFPARYRPIALEAVFRGLAGESVDHEVRVVVPAAPDQVLHVNVRTVDAAGGGVVATIQDVTSERDKDRLPRTLGRALQDAADAVVALDDGGRFEYTNAGFARTFGYGPEIVMGQHVSMLAASQSSDPQHLLELESAVASAEASGRWAGELTLYAADGSPVPVYLACVSVRDAVGRRTGAVATIRDMSGPKRQAEQLARAQRLASLGTLISGVGHELRNAINNVQLLIDEDAAEVQDVARTFQELRREVERAAGVVAGLNLVARSESDAIRRVATDLNEIVRHQMRMAVARSIVDGPRLRVELSLGEHIPAVFGDRPKLEQVLDNLLTNAAHALRGVTDPLIRVETYATSLGAAVRVFDNGMGISGDIVERIFDPFFTTKGPGEGTGLGLAVSHAIVDQHGGTLDVESEPGCGTAFTVDLPADRARTAGSRRVPAAPPARTLRVLVVDDESIPRARVSEFLASRGHVVDAAVDGQDALDQIDHLAAQGAAYDVIVSDLWMPRVTGVQLREELAGRGDPLGGRMLFVTGDSAASGASRSLADAQVLPKPYTLADVARRVEALADVR